MRDVILTKILVELLFGDPYQGGQFHYHHFCRCLLASISLIGGRCHDNDWIVAHWHHYHYFGYYFRFDGGMDDVVVVLMELEVLVKMASL